MSFLTGLGELKQTFSIPYGVLCCVSGDALHPLDSLALFMGVARGVAYKGYVRTAEQGHWNLKVFRRSWNAGLEAFQGTTPCICRPMHVSQFSQAGLSWR